MSDAVLIPLIVVGWLIVFPLFWSTIVWAVGFKWRSIARDYPASDWPSDGYKVSWQSARLGLANYGSALNFQATDDGLYARPNWFFRIGHPPIFIPWSEIERVDPAWLGGNTIRTRAGHSLTVMSKLGEAVQQAIRAQAAGEMGDPDSLGLADATDEHDRQPGDYEKRRPSEEGRRRSRT